MKQIKTIKSIIKHCSWERQCGQFAPPPHPILLLGYRDGRSKLLQGWIRIRLVKFWIRMAGGWTDQEDR